MVSRKWRVITYHTQEERHKNVENCKINSTEVNGHNMKYEIKRSVKIKVQVEKR